MEPTLTWLDLTAADQKRMRRVLDLFHEPQTRDEMGLANLRDSFSESLFPGTSTIQTRLRYVLFVPWIYQRLETRPPARDQLASRARADELGLIAPLASSDDRRGVIGIRARGSLKRLPSAVYWWPLVRWGVFRPGKSQSWYHAHLRELAGRGRVAERADDPGVIWTREPTWHPSLPPPPRTFPERASFALTAGEAAFLQGRITETCAGTLLGWLAQEGGDHGAASPWDEPSLPRAKATIRDRVELARRFSLHIEGMALIYNLLLAEAWGERFGSHGSDPDIRSRAESTRRSKARSVEHYRERIEEWATREDAEEQPFGPNALWAFAAGCRTRVPTPQRRFVEGWSRRLAETGARGAADDAQLRRLVRDREIQLKRGRARLANPARLLEWGGDAGMGRMEFRWSTVLRLLRDLHRGIETAAAPDTGAS